MLQIFDINSFFFLVPELSDFVSIQTTSTTRAPHSSRCKFGEVMNHTTFIGGLKAGNFSNKGQVRRVFFSLLYILSVKKSLTKAFWPLSKFWPLTKILASS